MATKRPRRAKPSRRAKPCPDCGSGDTVPILYGLYGPGSDGLPENIELGGCTIFEGQPMRRCRNCGCGFELRDFGGGEGDR